MPLSTDRSKIEASSIETVCTELAVLLAKIEVILEHNSDLAIDWAAGSTPAYIAEDVDGNIDGLYFSRQDVSNAIGSLDWFRKLATNQDLTGAQGDHLGNINKLARAMPLR